MLLSGENALSEDREDEYCWTRITAVQVIHFLHKIIYLSSLDTG